MWPQFFHIILSFHTYFTDVTLVSEQQVGGMERYYSCPELPPYLCVFTMNHYCNYLSGEHGCQGNHRTRAMRHYFNTRQGAIILSFSSWNKHYDWFHCLGQNTVSLYAMVCCSHRATTITHTKQCNMSRVPEGVQKDMKWDKTAKWKHVIQTDECPLRDVRGRGRKNVYMLRKYVSMFLLRLPGRCQGLLKCPVVVWIGTNSQSECRTQNKECRICRSSSRKIQEFQIFFSSLMACFHLI